ncbi:MAG: ABC transporter substrate-binding protein, partial [Chloroflexi bacterium]|nr:ABC transporter substrate-binding protein [Chloroflexota bacterium]
MQFPHRLGAALPIAFALLTGAACAAPAAPTPSAPASPAATSQAAATPRSGGTFKFVGQFEPAIWDPHLSEAKATQDQGLIYPRLVQYKTGPGVDPNEFIVVADLAEKWEQTDDKTYVFHLRNNARWSREAPANGRQIVAEDVAFSFNRLASDKSPFRGNWSAVEKIEAVDPLTVRFTLKQPFSPFLRYVAYHGSRLLAPEVVKECGDLRKAECARKVGGGPWLLDQYDPGVQITYRKNPDYYDAPRPYLDKIVRPMIPDATAREAAFLGKKIDAGVSVNATRAASIKRDQPSLLWGEQGGAQMVLTFNVTQKPWNDLRIRKAVSQGLDRQGFINAALQGNGKWETPARVWFGDWALSQDEIKKATVENPVQAKQLLAEAGFPNGLDAGKLLVWPGGSGSGGYAEQAAVIADQLKRNAGITMAMDMPEYGVWYDRFNKSDFGVTLGVYARSYPDPDDYLYARYHVNGSRNYGKCDDPKLNGLLEQQRTATDETKRKAQVRDIQSYYLTDVVCSVIFPSES